MTSSFFPLATPVNPFDRTNPLEALASANAFMQQSKQSKPMPTVGEERTIPIGTQYYTGKNYGFQTPGALANIPVERTSSDRMEQAYFRELQKNLKNKDAVDRQQADQRGQETPTSTGQPSQKPGAQKTDPEIDEYNKILRELTLNPELRAKLGAQDTAEFIKRSLITQALSLEQSRENTRRQLEVQNIQAWRDLERARIEANSRQALAFGQTIALAMVPNQGLMQGMNQAFANAMTPFVSRGA
jgi:hypothetical protein